MHVKALLESDNHKGFLIEVLEDDTIISLKKRIGERMEAMYEQFRGLKNL